VHYLLLQELLPITQVAVVALGLMLPSQARVVKAAAVVEVMLTVNRDSLIQGAVGVALKEG